MSLLNLFKRKKRHLFTDEDRDKSKEIREQQSELRQIKQDIAIQKEKLKLQLAKAELEDLQDELYGNEEDESTPDTPDKLFTSLLLKAFGGVNSQNPPLNVTAPKGFTIPQEWIDRVKSGEVKKKEVLKLLDTRWEELLQQV